MNVPPPIPPIPARKQNPVKLVIVLIVGSILILFLVGYFVVHTIVASGITKGPDNLFGDQNLKTAVALIELNKVRYGKYPDKLRDLKFTGQWDQMALQSVAYYPNADRTHYYIEVQRGWIGKPSLQIPDEFWHGTGYDPSLKPKGE
jgi:hypothetical protein